MAEHNVIYDLFMLKHTLATQVCEKCNQSNDEFSIIQQCHHIICEKCYDHNSTITSHCPVCNVKFDPMQNVSSHQDMKAAISEMENLVYKISLWEKGTLNATIPIWKERYEDVSNIKKIEPDITHPKLVKSTQNKDVFEHTKFNPNGSQSSTDLFTYEVKDIQISENTTSNGQSNEFGPICFNSNRNIKLTYEDQKNNFEEQHSNCGGESEEDVIEGTPKRMNISTISNSINQENKNIVFACSNFDHESELEVLRKFADLFNLEGPIPWCNKVTHLVMKTCDSGVVPRTTKFMNALLSNCSIVTIEWASECLRSNSLLPEINYMPLDKSGESSPMISWQTGRGIIKSPMDWTKHCLIYFHSSVEFNDSYSEIIVWAKKVGFIVVNEMEQFIDNKLEMRIILADTNQSKDLGAQLPSPEEVISWINDYKAVTVFLDWFLECLATYRFVKIDSKFQVMKLNPCLKPFINLDDSLIEYEI